MEKEKGFTLIELMVVIAIIAILAAVIAPNAFKAIEKAKASRVVSDYKAIKTGSLGFYADVGQWPENGIDAAEANNGFLVNKNLAGDAIPGWDGPYLEKWTSDAPWGGEFTWCNTVDGGTGITGFEGGGVAPAADGNERYICVSAVPIKAAEKIDKDLDGTIDGDAGHVRYAAGVVSDQDVQILISAEGTP